MILHQIWFQGKENIPNKYKKYQNEWEVQYPEYQLWDQKKIENLLNSFNEKIKEYYNQLPFMIQKIDIAKYLILYRFGGIYVDMDVKFNKHLYDLYKNMNIDQNIIICDMYCAYNFIVRITLNNFFFIVKNTENHFIKLIIEESIKYKRKLIDIKPLYILKSTGPALITKCYNLYKYPEHIMVITKKYLDQYFTHKSDGSWWGDNGRMKLSKIFDKRDILILSIMIIIIIVILYIKIFKNYQ